MAPSTIYLGLDVHKDSLVGAADYAIAPSVYVN